MSGMQSSPKMLSVLFVTVSFLLQVIHGFTVSGDYVCSDSECVGALLNITSNSNFSLKCEDQYSCDGSHIVVHSASTLRPGGINCTQGYSCTNAKIVVYDSNLATDANNYLNCGVYGFAACERLNLTLVDSSIALYCQYGNCQFVEVHLFGSSTLELKQGSDNDYGDYDTTTIYLHDSSAQLIDNGAQHYTLVVAYTTSIPTTTPATSTPSLSSTTMTIPNTSTTFRIPNTTVTIPTSTISSTVVASTRVHTTNAHGGNGGCNAGSNVIMIAAIGGGVGVLLFVCGFCLGVKYSRKQEQRGHLPQAAERCQSEVEVGAIR